MATLAELPQVSECTVAGCSYNDHSHCHAGAVTISGEGSEARCATFIPLNVKGGLDTVLASVGACQRADCVHNEHLTCTATAVRVGAGADLADCLTYQPR
ncbi:MAG TPA: DUF1540 domain-containing protein [Actinotalea caeni]|uniref:DUF1540 domain-containing protein n=1 Tax=Actinotalea caeni TaxID=1348467 RepID=UPI00187895C5|nr:DUF1540 domain-containing protein [Actinotalea caeni]HLV54838.1 DUF1540 domain-containing protein [Actinotalea caeni]